MRHILVVVFLIMLLAVPWVITHPEQARPVFQVISNVEDRLMAAVVSHNPKTVSQIQSRYEDRGGFFKSGQKIKILLIPGHEPGFGGAEYGSLKEREMTVKLAEDLRDYLVHNDRFEVFVSRNNDAWDPIFENYFREEWDNIIQWKNDHKEEMKHLEKIGEYHPVVSNVVHNNAPVDVALRLFGMSKWANDNDIDIVLHIHFNDYPGHGWARPGKYSGFSIYVPEKGYFNSTTTREIASSVFGRLSRYSAISDFPGEKAGIVEDRDLIAVGAYNSVDAPSFLIEYGYIYEPQFANDELRGRAIRDLAFQTFLGLQDFFDPKRSSEIAQPYDTKTLPYVWNRLELSNDDPVSDVFALQTALIVDGSYPPRGKSLNDCPRTGTVGNCTRTALESFQIKNGIVDEKGRVGSKTTEALNRLSIIKSI